MPRSDDRTPDAVKSALEDLVQSDGWAILKELVEAHFGDAAQLQQIDVAMRSLAPADSMGQLAIVTQIRAASKAAFTVIGLAESKLRETSVKKAAETGFSRARRLLRAPAV